MAMPAKALPAVYAKFVTALAAAALTYLTAYGTTWHLQAALVGLGGALAVFGVPNATPPPAPAVAVRPLEPPTGTVTVVPATPPEATP